MSPYIDLEDANSDDNFGESDDEALLLAEASTLTNVNNKKRPSPFTPTDDAPKKKVKSADEAACSALGHRILKKTWGFPFFRLKQDAAIARLISGGSAVVIFPTGGGKSLVYQVPALAFDEYDKQCGLEPGRGVTLVISPLIALMKDQVDALKKRGVAAAAMDSSQSREAWLDTADKLRSSTLKLLYVAPERLNNEGFVEMISAVKATPKVADDICAAFDIDTEGVFRTTTYRSNLRLLAESYKSGEEKESALQKFLSQHGGTSIVYVQTHKQTEEVCACLRKVKINAYGYHAGMNHEARTNIQENFMRTKDIVIVATIAFGMGIDKADIRNVVHYSVPKSLEGYSQEIGRAGRDGLESTCLVYLCAEDLGIMEQWSRADLPSFKSTAGLIREVVDTNRHAQPGDIVERNTVDETREWDIRMNALGLLNAQLELRFELIRAITPKYAQYKYAKSPQFEAFTSDKSAVTHVLKKVSKTAKRWTHIDVDQAARQAGVDRAVIVGKLQDWHNRGAVELQPSGVINRFRILSKFPETEEGKLEIVRALHAYLETSERDGMAKVHDVIGLLTAEFCLSRGLAKHFGDEDSVPKEGCGHCSFCLSGKPVSFDQAHSRSRKGRINKTKLNAVLAATKVRDDARFLARVAVGISSPRVTMEKLGRHAVFGSMDDCDFDELVEQFTQACEA